MKLNANHGLRNATVAAVGGCAMAVAVVAFGRGLTGWTEIGGGTPAPPRPPREAVKSYNTDTTTTFTDQQSFLDSVTCRSVSLESFEEVVASDAIDTSTLSLDGIAITTSNPPQLGVWSRRFQGAFSTDGQQWLGVEENSLVVPHTTTLTFDLPINQFGINFTDYGDFGDGNLEFANDAGEQATAAFSGQPSGNLQFFGIINRSRAFRTVTLTHSIAGEFYGVDEITFCFDPSFDERATRSPSGRVTPD